MSYYTIGTAGHIDHGKTSLTKCLTNVDTDRLQEEKARNISIEPGFAPFFLPSGAHISLIDVPGHERFIRQMVAGVAGIDLVLFVVAADEGVMPQTVEHLHILSLLGISRGIIVLTKTDLVDELFLTLVREDVAQTVRGTFLANAPICETSTVTGEGIPNLKREIERQLATVPARSHDAPFRLPVDRVFSLKGVGTVVTGTVYAGHVQPGDEVDLLPDGQTAKVRHVQVHGTDVDTAYAGERAALNLAQVKKSDLARGSVLAARGHLFPTDRIDAFIRTLPDAPDVKHQASVNVYIGSAECTAQIILYDRSVLRADDEAYVTFRLRERTVASRDDRFIFRRPSPATTLGGGEVIRPYGQKMKYAAASATYLQQLHTGDDAERLRDVLTKGPIVQSIAYIAQRLGESEANVRHALSLLSKKREIQEVLPSEIALTERLARVLREGQAWVARYHDDFPLRQGPSRAEWVTRFLPQTPPKTVAALFQLWSDHLTARGEHIATRSFQTAIPKNLQKKSEQLLAAVKQRGGEATPWRELTTSDDVQLDEQTSVDLLTYFVNNGTLYTTDGNQVIHSAYFRDAEQKIVDFLTTHGELTLQDARDLLHLSRKHLVPLLELMDREGVTRREGNKRLLSKTSHSH